MALLQHLQPSPTMVSKHKICQKRTCPKLSTEGPAKSNNAGEENCLESTRNPVDDRSAPRGPFKIFRQAWRDYKTGRMMRKTNYTMPKIEDKKDEEVKSSESRSTQTEQQARGETQIEPIATAQEEKQPESQVAIEGRRSLHAHGKQKAVEEVPLRSHCKGWKPQTGEYAWSIRKTIYGEDNWRGTWILEVKDLLEINWKRVRIHDRKGWRWEEIPHGQWPFPQDSKHTTNATAGTSERWGRR